LIQVKSFDYKTMIELEENVNQFLMSMNRESSFNMIDIKYNSYNYDEDRKDYHSALIVYEY